MNTTTNPIEQQLGAYELFFILNPALDSEKQTAIINKIQEIIKQNEGEVKELNPLGKKELATPFNKQTQGYYVYVKYSGSGKTNLALRQNFKVTEEVIRFLLVSDKDAAAKKRPEKAKRKKSASADKVKATAEAQG